jgi:hypothetical protein
MAYNFTAANSRYLLCNSAPVIAAPLTIACWFRTSNNNQAIVSIGKNAGIARFQLQTNTGTGIRTFTANESGAFDSLDNNSKNVTTNSWFHSAVSHSAANSRILYVNGENPVTGTTNIIMSSLDRTLIAARINNTVGGYFSGDIAEVGIWNAALTAAEIASLAKGMTCDKVRPQSLVFYAPLVRDLIDAKGGLTITNNNGATVANHPRVYA